MSDEPIAVTNELTEIYGIKLDGHKPIFISGIDVNKPLLSLELEALLKCFAFEEGRIYYNQLTDAIISLEIFNNFSVGELEYFDRLINDGYLFEQRMGTKLAPKVKELQLKLKHLLSVYRQYM